MDLLDNFAKNLQYLRKKAHMTQKELADTIGYSEKAISKWETGKAVPPLVTIQSIAKVFNTTIDDMIEPKDHRDDII